MSTTSSGCLPASVDAGATESSDDFVWELDCGYDDSPHTYPGDWVFGGPYKTAPQADPRWRPTTYEYYDDRLAIIHTTQTPLCDEQAIDEFTKVARFGPGFNPTHISARRPDGTLEMLKVVYNKATDTASDM